MGFYDFGNIGTMDLFKKHVSIQDVAMWAERTRHHRKARFYKHNGGKQR